VEACALYLKHLRDAWNFEMGKGKNKARFEDQDVYLTVPASFDAVARELTIKAAQSAGLEKMTLLEELQAPSMLGFIVRKRNGAKRCGSGNPSWSVT
jgi:molecular chaperone DnaK (HSP70)